MRDERKTKAQLIRELRTLNGKLKKLEKSKEQWKRAETAMRESEEQYRLLFENSGEAILVTQQDGQILSANPAACRMYGRSEDEIRKLGRAGLTDVTDPRLKSALEERRKTGKFSGELNLLRKDGTVFPAYLSSVVFRDSQGNERTSMFVNDMTERKRAEEALRESEERFTKAFRTIPDALIISVPEDGRIVEVNDTWQKVFGYSREEVIGKSSLALDLFADSADRQRVIALLREQGFVRDFKVQIRQKSGALRTAILSIELLEIQGEQYMLTVVQDITARAGRGSATAERGALSDVGHILT